VMNDASTMAATGALVNCTSRSGLRWRQPYTRLAATTSSTWCSLLAHKKSAEIDSILYGILESVQQFIANKATIKLWIVTRGSLNISVDGGEAVVPW
jgi:hypothetical protein